MTKKVTRDRKGHFLPGNKEREGISPEQRDEAKRAFLEMYSKRFTMSEAAWAAGVHRQTILNWAATDAEFKAAIAEVRNHFLDNVEASLYDRATDPDIDGRTANTAAAILLNAMRAEEYRPKGSGQGQGNVVFQLIVGERPKLSEPHADVTYSSAELPGNAESEVNNLIDSMVTSDES